MRRDEKDKRRKEEALEAHQSSDYDTINTIKKIYEVRLPTMIGVGHKRQTTHLFLEEECDTLRSLLMIFFSVADLSRQDFYNGTSGIIIKTLICLQGLFLFFFSLIFLIVIACLHLKKKSHSSLIGDLDVS